MKKTITILAALLFSLCLSIGYAQQFQLYSTNVPTTQITNAPVLLGFTNQPVGWQKQLGGTLWVGTNTASTNSLRWRQRLTNSVPSIVISPVDIYGDACYVTLTQLFTATNAAGQLYVTNRFSPTNHVYIGILYDPPNGTNALPHIRINAGIR